MKRLLTFKQLNETFSNWTLVRDYADKMWNELHKSGCYKREIFHEPEHMKIYYDCLKDDSIIKSIEKILKKWRNNLLTIDILLSYNYFALKKYGQFTVFVKSIYTKRVKTSRYVYHCSNFKNRESILQNGLIPKEHKESKEWASMVWLDYPPSVFATDGGLMNTWHTNVDIWRIDTKGLTNKWWYDLNLFAEGKNYIMTFESIPPENIQLAKDSTNDKFLFLKTDEMVTEVVHNQPLVLFEIKRMLVEIDKIHKLKKSNLGVNNIEKLYSTINTNFFHVELKSLDSKFENRINKILNKYQNIIFPKIDIIMKYKLLYQNTKMKDGDSVFDFETLTYNITFKNIHIQRYVPKTRYIFHCTDRKNRESIQEKGLIPKSDKESEDYKNDVSVNYPPAVFATTNRDLWLLPNDKNDVWAIDTKGLPNKWWYDLYFRKDDNDNKILTFEPIPPNHLKLYDKRKFTDFDNFLMKI